MELILLYRFFLSFLIWGLTMCQGRP